MSFLFRSLVVTKGATLKLYSMVISPQVTATDRPAGLDFLLYFSTAFSSILQSSTDHLRTYRRAKPHDSSAPYDPGTQSWTGSSGLRYRVPLMDLPSEFHSRMKRNNIKIVMDNVETLYRANSLPATEKEREFWSTYRLQYWALFFQPFVMMLPVFYLGFRRAQFLIPMHLKGRFMPLLFSAGVADEIQDGMYPGRDYIHQALTSETPLGDAARAEWLRLQPLNITGLQYKIYAYRRLSGSPYEELAFGGDVSKTTFV